MQMISSRRDISDWLIHFTKGDSHEEAFQRLCSIVRERRILGTSERIKGGYQCVCFSEAPLTSLQDGLVNPDAYSRYSPFGIIFGKRSIFAQGGRPVIYQTDEEFSQLPEGLRWKHVRYEPNREPPCDFTWEREWRVQCSYLPIDPSYAGIVVPSVGWAQKMTDKLLKESISLKYKSSEPVTKKIAELLDDRVITRELPCKISLLEILNEITTTGVLDWERFKAHLQAQALEPSKAPRIAQEPSVEV